MYIEGIDSTTPVVFHPLHQMSLSIYYVINIFQMPIFFSTRLMKIKLLTYLLDLRTAKGYFVKCHKAGAGNKRSSSDYYGCANWQPDHNMSEAELEAKRQWMAEESKKTHPDLPKIRAYFKETYSLQRKCINENTAIKTIQSEWPFLFVDEFLILHYSILVGKHDVKATFLGQLSSNAILVYRLVIVFVLLCCKVFQFCNDCSKFA